MLQSFPRSTFLVAYLPKSQQQPRQLLQHILQIDKCLSEVTNDHLGKKRLCLASSLIEWIFRSIFII